ncbi:MAG: hypothetical protein ACOX9C_06285 [Kiritimatiellia bacterium]|jgi:hypothetical protein
MRTLFIAVSRVFGLLQIYCGLLYITSILPLSFFMRTQTSVGVADMYATTFAGTPIVLVAGGMIASVLLIFGMGWLLLCRADWLADKLAIPELDDRPTLTADAVFQIGTRLLGLYVVIQALPVLVGQLGGTISAIRQAVSLSDSLETGYVQRMILERICSGFVVPVLKLALGLLLVLKTDALQQWLDTRKKKHKNSVLSVDKNRQDAKDAKQFCNSAIHHS